jgi:hypothetical protein
MMAPTTPDDFRPIVLATLLLFGACTTLPHGYDQLRWRDQRGDRGVGVAQRDLSWCIDAAETRRGLIAECMAMHGWLKAD